MWDHKLLKQRLLDKWSQCSLCKLFLKICYSSAGKIMGIDSALGEFHIIKLQNSVKFGIPLHFVPQKCMIRNCFFPEVLSGEIKSIKIKIKRRLSKSKETDFRVEKSNPAVVEPKWETESEDNCITTPHHKTPTSLNTPTHST